jgi:hypothetical protein
MGGKSSRAVKAPKYLNNYYLSDNSLIITIDGAKPNPGADVTPEKVCIEPSEYYMKCL